MLSSSSCTTGRSWGRDRHFVKPIREKKGKGRRREGQTPGGAEPRARRARCSFRASHPQRTFPVALVVVYQRAGSAPFRCSMDASFRSPLRFVADTTLLSLCFFVAAMSPSASLPRFGSEPDPSLYGRQISWASPKQKVTHCPESSPNRHLIPSHRNNGREECARLKFRASAYQRDSEDARTLEISSSSIVRL